jgi:hypothetical protein
LGRAAAGRLRFFLLATAGRRYPADGNDDGIGSGSCAGVP